jgi:hypothetical protein
MQVFKDISDRVGEGGGARIHRTSDNGRRGTSRGVRPETSAEHSIAYEDGKGEGAEGLPIRGKSYTPAPTTYYLHDDMRAPASLQASAHDLSSHQHRNETQRPKGSDGRGSRVEGRGSRVQGRRSQAEGVGYISHQSAFNLDNPRHAEEFESWLGGLMGAPEDIPTFPNRQNKEETHQTQGKGLLLANRGANLEVEAAEHAMLLRREESLRSMESQRSHFSRSSQTVAESEGLHRTLTQLWKSHSRDSDPSQSLSRYSHSDESQYSRYSDQSRSEYSEYSSASKNQSRSEYSEFGSASNRRTS